MFSLFFLSFLKVLYRKINQKQINNGVCRERVTIRDALWTERLVESTTTTHCTVARRRTALRGEAAGAGAAGGSGITRHTAQRTQRAHTRHWRLALRLRLRERGGGRGHVSGSLARLGNGVALAGTGLGSSPHPHPPTHRIDPDPAVPRSATTTLRRSVTSHTVLCIINKIKTRQYTGLITIYISNTKKNSIQVSVSKGSSFQYSSFSVTVQIFSL